MATIFKQGYDIEIPIAVIDRDKINFPLTNVVNAILAFYDGKGSRVASFQYAGTKPEGYGDLVKKQEDESNVIRAKITRDLSKNIPEGELTVRGIVLVTDTDFGHKSIEFDLGTVTCERGYLVMETLPVPQV